MDRKVVARFYQVENLDPSDRTLFDCLGRLWQADDRDTWTEIGTEVRVKLLRHGQAADDAHYVEGEFIRQQRDNVPPIAPDDGPLEAIGQPIGHCCAYRYYPEYSVLLLESRREAVTPSRISLMVNAKVHRHKGFVFSPCLTETALARLQNGTPRILQFRVARPGDLALVEDRDPLRVDENVAALARTFGGPNVEVKVSWPQGNHTGRLSMAAISSLFGFADNNRDHFEKFKVKIQEEPDAIDLFEEQIREETELDLPDDIDDNYQMRRTFLQHTFRAHFRTIERLYGNG